eukprot:Filipodium_phascolosomae@DN2350_c0_g1_i2.p1
MTQERPFGDGDQSELHHGTDDVIGQTNDEISLLLGCMQIQSKNLATTLRNRLEVKDKIILERYTLQGICGGKVLSVLLEHTPRVKTLAVNHNSLGNKGFSEALQKVLAHTPVTIFEALEELDCSVCSLSGRDGGQVVSLVLLHTEALMRLAIRQNMLGLEGILEILNIVPACKLQHLKVLDCSGCNIVGQAGGDLIARLLQNTCCLESLHINLNQIGLDGLSELTTKVESWRLKHLKEFYCWGCKIDGAIGGALLVEILLWPASLERLNIDQNLIGNLGLAEMIANRSIEKLSDLRQLKCCGCNIGGRTGGRFLAELLSLVDALEKLELGRNPIGNIGFQEITTCVPAERFQELREFDCSACNLLEDDGSEVSAGELLAEFLTLTPHITKLDLHKNTIGNNGLDDILKAVPPQNFSNIKDLNIWGCALEGEAGGRLASQLLCCTTAVERLSLDRKNIELLRLS